MTCRTCGERFADEDRYPQHEDRSGKKCPMSGKRVAKDVAPIRDRDAAHRALDRVMDGTSKEANGITSYDTTDEAIAAARARLKTGAVGKLYIVELKSGKYTYVHSVASGQKNMGAIRAHDATVEWTRAAPPKKPRPVGSVLNPKDLDRMTGIPGQSKSFDAALPPAVQKLQAKLFALEKKGESGNVPDSEFEKIDRELAKLGYEADGRNQVYKKGTDAVADCACGQSPCVCDAAAPVKPIPVNVAPIPKMIPVSKRKVGDATVTAYVVVGKDGKKTHPITDKRKAERILADKKDWDPDNNYTLKEVSVDSSQALDVLPIPVRRSA